MKGKKIILILFLAVAIFLGLAVFLVVNNIAKPKIPAANQPAQIETPVLPPKVIESSKMEGGAILAVAKEKKDPTECLKISDERYAEACVDLLAQDMKDENACSVIKNQVQAARCIDGAIFKKATEKGDARLCISIKDESLDQSCIINVVRKQGLKEGDCSALPDKEKGYCLDYLSYVADGVAFNGAQSVDDCQKISGETAKAFCLDKFKN